MLSEKKLEKINRTHRCGRNNSNQEVKKTHQKIIARGDLLHVSIEKQLDFIRQLEKFPLGKFMLKNRGVNGYWTDYIINFSNFKKHHSPSELEDYILNRFPLTLATRERFKIFQTQIQKRLKNDMVLASIPCGCMRDLLTLDYSNVTNFKLIGIDIDQESLDLAKQLAFQTGLNNHLELQLKDAWNLNFKESIDLITSNGLNVYEPDNEKVIDLYKGFFKALKPNGILIVGVLTYPPGKNHQTDWILDNINMDDYIVEKIVFEDILGSKWRNYRSIEDIYNDFHKAGFKNVSIVFDKYHIFPTIITEKKE